jgi:hypothetical protein
MAITGISITKRVAYRDSLQEFSNVYFYRVLTQPNQTQAEALIDEITTFEKTIHASVVTFVRGRCWSAGGTNQDNNMRVQKPLSGVGATTATVSIDRERAHLFRWPAGLDSRGKPVYLRKYYHCLGPVAGVATGQTQLTGEAGFSQGNRDTMAAAINAIRLIGGGAYQLCAESGRDSAGPAEAHKYLEHHQLGDQWRAQ